MEPNFISPIQAANQRELLLLDIRPTEERFGELGFIPGSLSVPMQPPWSELNVPLDMLQSASGVVLTCLSGQRATMAARHSLHDKPVFVMQGGTLSWVAEGLPFVSLVRTDERLDGVDSLSSFMRALRSCFVAEWVETSVATEAEDIADPVALLESCLLAEGISAREFSLRAVQRAMDRLAWHSLRVGTARAKIASNLNVMLNTLQSISNQ